MLNSSDVYHFRDFTLSNFEKILLISKKHYNFTTFNETVNDKCIILRHDVEFSTKIAEKMAVIEALHNIRATYFIQLHSNFYNVLEDYNFGNIKNILQLGHKIGLHFDSHFWKVTDEADINKAISKDKKILECYFDTSIDVFSFHNNNEFTLSCRNEKYGGLLNVYSDYFRNSFAYNADSLGFWRYERLEDILLSIKYDKMQILIHDGMWQEEVLPPRQRVFKVIDDNAIRLKKLYDDHLAKIGQKNIDWDSI